MKGSVVLLTVVALIAAISVPVAACIGGEGQQIYVQKYLTAPPMNHTAEPFKITKDDVHLTIRTDRSCRMRILKDADMKKFNAGEDYTAVWPEGNGTPPWSEKLVLDPGKYWVVVYNDDAKSITVHVRIHRPAEMCVSTPMLPEGIQFGGMAIVLILAFLVSVKFRSKRY